MDEQFSKIIEEFTIDRKAFDGIAAIFRRDIVTGLEGDEASSLKLLPAYLALPQRSEAGEFLALDFGGTNVRAARVKIDGHGGTEIIQQFKTSLRAADYDYTTTDCDSEKLFDFLAGLIIKAAEPGKEYYLGHTFSFASEQRSVNQAKLIRWNKEIAVSGVEGNDINELLGNALKRCGADNIKPVAVVNDTVAALLAAAYQQENTDIGSICGTGHNTAYLEKFRDEARPPMCFNLESGNFNKLVPNKYDKLVDAASLVPGEQRLEKMTSGLYIGRLFYEALADAFNLKQKAELHGEDISRVMSDQSMELTNVKKLMQDKLSLELDDNEAMWVRAIAESIVVRSAQLAAITYVAIIWKLDSEREGYIREHNIAVDGSLFEKMPLYAETMRKTISEMLGSDSKRVSVGLIKQGSLIGAAVAAAMVEK